MAYHVEFQPSALKQLRKLDGSIRKRLIRAAEELAEDPRPGGCVKLSGSSDEYRIRVGDYRIIYAVEDDRLVVLVLEARHRRHVYEKRDRKR